MTERYLSVTEVAQLLGISTSAASVYRLPEPDATIGRTRGWKRQTVETWNAARPDRVVGGGRPRSRS